MKQITTIIRGVLTLIVTYLAYRETGIWTAVCLLLIFLSIEILAWSLRALIQLVKLIAR